MKCNLPKEEPVKVSGDLNLSLYELTKSSIEQAGPANKEAIEKFKQLITGFCINHCNEARPTYFMLLNRDINYYTLFNAISYQDENTEHIADVVLECVNERGEIYSVVCNEDHGTIEIWAKVNDELGCYLFFEYSDGVIEVQM